jgi:hypothetical protein
LKEDSSKNKRLKASALLVIIVLVSIVCLTLFSSQVSASTDWNATITASLSTTPPYTADCVFGVKAGATNSFDTAYDQIATPNPPVGINAWFAYPNDPVQLFQKLSTSYIPSSDTSSWTYKVATISPGGTVTLSWSASEIATAPSNFNIYLQDSSGTVTLKDMRSTNSYSYSAGADTTNTFIIELISTASSPSPSPSPTPTTTPTIAATPTVVPTVQPTSNPTPTSTPSPTAIVATSTPSPTTIVTTPTTSFPSPSQILSPSPSPISPLATTPLYLYAVVVIVISAISATALIIIRKRR